MEGKQRRLEHEPDQHQPGGDPDQVRCIAIDQRHQGSDRDRAVSAVDQGDAEQIGTGADQGGEQVAQGGRDLRRLPTGRDQGDGGETDQFEGDVEVEEVGRQEQGIEAGDQESRQGPEVVAGRIARFEIGPGVERQQQCYGLHKQQHRG